MSDQQTVEEKKNGSNAMKDYIQQNKIYIGVAVLVVVIAFAMYFNKDKVKTVMSRNKTQITRTCSPIDSLTPSK